MVMSERSCVVVAGPSQLGIQRPPPNICSLPSDVCGSIVNVDGPSMRRWADNDACPAPKKNHGKNNPKP